MRARAIIPVGCAMLAWLLPGAVSPVARAQAPEGRGRGGGPPRLAQVSPEEKEKVRLRIGITKEQQAQIEAAHLELDKQRKELGDKLWEQYRKLGALYSSYDFDREQAKVIRREILALHRKILDLHFENEQHLRRILTKEQFERFQALMKETFEKRRTERGARRGNPGGPPAGARPQ